jgi:hypothetical protein
VATRDTVDAVAEELASALLPLVDALASPDNFQAFLVELGWSLTTPPPSVQALSGPVAGVAPVVGGGGVDSGSAPVVIAAIRAFLTATGAIQGEPAGSFPPGFDVAAFKAEFPGQLLQFLVVEYLLGQRARLGELLKALGVVRVEDEPAAAGRLPYTKRELAFAELANVLGDPLAVVRDAYAWGDSGFRVDRLFGNGSDLLSAWGLPHRFEGLPPEIHDLLTGGALDPASVSPEALKLQILQEELTSGVEAGIGLFALPETATAKPGFALLPYAQEAVAVEIPLTETLTLALRGGVDFAGGVAIVVRPGAPVELLADIVKSAGAGTAPTAAASAALALVAKPAGGAGLVLLGSSDASRLEVASVSIETGARADSTGKHDLYVETDVRGAKLVVAPGGDADSFLSSLLPGDGFELDFDLLAGLSGAQGFYFGGSSDLEVQVPVHLTVGPIDVSAVTIALKPAAGTLPVELGATIKGSLGPLQAVVENIGLRATLSFPAGNTGNLGPVDVALGFKPPNGVGLSIDAGVVSGGGFLYIDTARGEYAGALQLSIADFLSVSAIGLISTRLPDGSPGFSLLVILTAEFGTGIQLGFGFTLLAVGGLLGLNRTMLFQPLLDGIRTDSIESVMFPHDVVANAPRIISDLRAIFPPQQGVFLIGPMAKLGWGEPTLVSLALGVVMEIPPGDVAILGVLKVALPAEELAILVLQVNFAGVLEFDKQRFYFFAALYDSHILFLTIEGEMGVLFAYGDDANFVLSVGGFHPQFNPPPLPFPTPKRIQVDIINESFARIHCDGYFAVTTNTVQFGSHSDYFFGFSALSVQGHSGFDALIQFSPFHFTVEISTQFSVDVFGIGVYGIGIDLTLEGPTPWHAHGTASISFFFFSIDIGIDFTWGDSRDTTLPPVQVMPIVAGELGKQSNWRAVLPGGSNLLVSLRQLDQAESQFVLHPVGTLQVSQRAVPLDLVLDKVGNQKPSDANRFSLAVTSTGLAKSRDLQEQFAPSQFKSFDDATRLSQPAYAPEDGGIELSASGSAYASATALTRVVRYDLTIIDTKLRRFRSRFFQFTGALFVHFLSGASVAFSTLSAFQKAQTTPFVDTVAVNAETFAVANRADNTVFRPEAAAFTSVSSASDYVARAVAEDPSLADTLHVLPQFEVAA